MKETFIDSKGFKILFLLLIVVIVIIVVINTVFMSKSDEEENMLNNGVAEENILTAEEIDENTKHFRAEARQYRKRDLSDGAGEGVFKKRA